MKCISVDGKIGLLHEKRDRSISARSIRTVSVGACEICLMQMFVGSQKILCESWRGGEQV